MIYRALQTLVRPVIHWLIRLRVDGLEHVPAEGPFLLVANHQSIVDPVLIQAFLRRQLFTLTKSWEVSRPIWGRLMMALGVIPVKRYETDPGAVRSVLRVLARGEGVGLYLEGERTWDGRLQPFKRTGLKLLLRAGVPIVPCAIQGTFDLLPRWASWPRRASVRITISPPVEPPSGPPLHALRQLEAVLRLALDPYRSSGDSGQEGAVDVDRRPERVLMLTDQGIPAEDQPL